MGIWDILKTADDYATDWYGYLTNQSAHNVLVGVPMAAMLMFIMSPIAALITVFFLYFVIWELAIQSGDNLQDSLADTFHVMVGAGFVALLVSYIPPETRSFVLINLLTTWVFWASCLFIGVVRRLRAVNRIVFRRHS